MLADPFLMKRIPADAAPLPEKVLQYCRRNVNTAVYHRLFEKLLCVKREESIEIYVSDPLRKAELRQYYSELIRRAYAEELGKTVRLHFTAAGNMNISPWTA